MSCLRNFKFKNWVLVPIFSFLLVAVFGCGAMQKDNENVIEELANSLEDDTQLGVTIYPLDTFYDHMATCEQGTGDLVADAMKYYATGAEIALINAGTIRRRGVSGPTQIDPGIITQGDINLLFPFDNLTAENTSVPSTIVLVSLTGVVLKEAFENSFSRMQSDGSPGTSFGRFLQVSGIEVNADVTLPVNSRITNLALLSTGETIDMTDNTKSYRVAIPLKYVKGTTGFSDFDSYWNIFEKGSDLVNTEIYVINATAQYIKNFSPMEYAQSCGTDRYRIFIKSSTI